MTDLQLEVLDVVQRAARRGEWYRAAHPGQRVTLASLYYRGILDRRARRGKSGAPNAAYEYTPARGGLAR